MNSEELALFYEMTSSCADFDNVLNICVVVGLRYARIERHLGDK